MLNDLLPENINTIRLDDLDKIARQATKTGDFAQAAAILANGYDRGGPAILMDQAYTYAHYLIISRRMLRHGVDMLKWERGKEILENYSSLYDDELVDQLTSEFSTNLKTWRGTKREPSGAMLLEAELRLANGEDTQSVIDTLPQSESIHARANALAAQAYYSADEPELARPAFNRALAAAPRNQTALSVKGKCALQDGDLELAAENFDKNLRAVFAPVPEGKIPAGELHYRSTVLNRFDIYAYSGGFFVVKKRPGLIGVTMVGRNILQVMETRGYRQWIAVKSVLSRFLPLKKIRGLLFPVDGGDDQGVGHTGLVGILYRIYDRVIVALGADAIRPDVKNAALAVYPYIAPLLTIIKYLLLTLRSPLRVVKSVLRKVAAIIYQIVLISWLKAQEVPQQQRVDDADDIYAVVNRMLEEEEALAMGAMPK